MISNIAPFLSENYVIVIGLNINANLKFCIIRLCVGVGREEKAAGEGHIREEEAADKAPCQGREGRRREAGSSTRDSSPIEVLRAIYL